LNKICCERAAPLSPFNFDVKSRKSISVKVRTLTEIAHEINVKSRNKTMESKLLLIVNPMISKEIEARN
jgi:hypothetical protein